MASSEDKSCYVLELSVGPGGSRWAELHAYTDKAHIRAWIDVFCQNDGGLSAYHAIWYGATLGVWTIQRGEVVDFIDLHPLIRARLPGGESAPLVEEDQVNAMVRQARKAQLDEEREKQGDDEEFDEDDYEDTDFDTFERLEMECDWSAVEKRLAPLEPPLLAPGQKAKARRNKKFGVSSYLERAVRFGSYDEEAGTELEPPFEIELPDTDEDDEDEEDEDED